MAREKSIFRSIFVKMVALIALQTLLIGIFWLSADLRRHHDAARHSEEETIARQKREIHDQIRTVFHLIEAHRQLNAHSSHALSEDSLKAGLLEDIGRIRFGENGQNYIFVVSFDGVTLMNGVQRERIGKNIWEMTDPNGVKVIQEERRAAEKPCGDYIFYSWPKPPGMKVTPKLSYVRGLSDWRWMIGCGVYLDDVEQLRAANHQRTVRDLTLKIVQIMVALVLMLTASLLVALYLSRRMGRQFETITSSFVKAGTNGEWIDEQSLRYTEFRLLARAANHLTERRRNSDEALHQEKERLAVILASIGDGILVSDRQGTVAMMNRAAGPLTGWDAATAIGRPLDEVLVLTSPDDPENRAHPARQALETQRVVPFSPDLLLLAPSGEKRYVLGSSAPIRSEDGQPAGVVTVVSDISEQRRMSDEYLRFARLESVGLLAGGIAHDFNNILTVIIGNISLILARTETDSTHLPLLANVETAALRARDLTHQLLTFAKGGEPVRETADIRELLQESVAFSLRGSKVSYQLNIAPDLWSVRFDRGQMNQVIRNLVINAEQAMPEGGTITIAAENVQVDPGELLPLAPGPYVSILVHDTGCGIPKEIQKRIFEPFFTTKENGSGLGLAVAHSIVKKHNGYLDVYSELGCGTTFSLFLPAVEATTPPEASPDSLPLNGTGRVLVMDDEEMVRHSTGAMLAHLGYTPILARDGREAIEVCTRAVATGEKLLTVIMDLTIPGGMGGVEAQREISRIAPDLPLIVSSGYSNDPVLARFREFGFTAFLVKPFHLRDLAQTLARLNPAPPPDRG